MNNPKVSVALITYNHAGFIEQSIKSILNQNCGFDYEIIISDDHSFDGTSEICKKYADLYPERIVYKCRMQNLGVQGNWAKTIEECRGEYVALCEGDDYWTDPDKLQKQVDFLENNTDYVITYHDVIRIDSSGEVISESELKTQFKRDCSGTELIRNQIYIHSATVCFKKNNLIFPPEFYRMRNADIFLFSLLGKFGKGGYLGTVRSSAYREHIGGVWSQASVHDRKSMQITSYFWLSMYYKRMNDFEIALFFYQKLNTLISDEFSLIENISERINPYANSTNYKVGKLLLSPFHYLKKLLKN